MFPNKEYLIITILLSNKRTNCDSLVLEGELEFASGYFNIFSCIYVW